MILKASSQGEQKGILWANILLNLDILAFFAYVSFFRQLVAGPIERATNLLPQF